MQTATSRDLGRIAWADVDGMTLEAEPKLVADPNDMRFEAITAPKKALRWPRGARFASN